MQRAKQISCILEMRVRAFWTLISCWIWAWIWLSWGEPEKLSAGEVGRVGPPAREERSVSWEGEFLSLEEEEEEEEEEKKPMVVVVGGRLG
jgi:hypothetical protein